jgi:hypothetical protein
LDLSSLHDPRGYQEVWRFRPHECRLPCLIRRSLDTALLIDLLHDVWPAYYIEVDTVYAEPSLLSLDIIVKRNTFVNGIVKHGF